MLGADAKGSPEADQRTPERAVEIEDQSRLPMRHRVSFLEDTLNIGGEIQRFGEDYEIELPVELEIFACHDMELTMRYARARRLDCLAGEIYADHVLIWEDFQQMARAATDLQDARIGRNKITVMRRDQLPVEKATCGGLDRPGIVE